MAIIGNFTFTECDHTGSDGFIPDYVKGADATHSVAHDLLEHFPGDLPGVEGELMAIGAAVLIRLENGNSYPPNYGDNVASLVYDPLMWALENNRKIKPLVSYKLGDNYSWADDIMRDGANKVHAMLIAESKHLATPIDIPYTKDELSTIVLSWLRKGYRKALGRYSEVDIYSMSTSLFKKVDDLSERIVRSGYMYEGAKVRFVANVRQSTVTAFSDGRNLSDFV